MRHNLLSTALSIAIVGTAPLLILPNAWGGTATLSWDENTESDLAGYNVYYGLSGAYSQSLDVGKVTSYTVSGLPDGQTYYFAVTAYDTLRNEGGYSNEASKTFRDATPPLLSAIAARNVSATSATISWFTNEPADSEVEYGPTAAYGSTTPLNISQVTSHSMTLSGLTASMTYHFRVTSRDAAGNVAASADFSFRTTTAGSTAIPRLIGLSARARVLTADNVLIGGFIIQGTTPKTVLLRARGPSLGDPPFNNLGALANPTMQLYSGQTVIAQNDNWQTSDPLCGSPAIACGGVAQVTATAMDPCQSNPGQTGPPANCTLEATLLVTLPPGGYTAIVSGVGGGTGIGLVEVFELSQ